MSLRYKDKVVVVTGGAYSIGAGIARLFAENGSKVIIADIESEYRQKLAAQLTSAGPGESLFVKCDVSKEEEVKHLVQQTMEQFRRIDCVVNNAGINEPGTRFIDEFTPESFQPVWAVNVLGTLMVSKYCLPHLRQVQGNIINISSIFAEVGCGNDLGYCATKGAITSLSKALALSEAKHQVRVNVITPGPVWNRHNERQKQQNPEKEIKSRRILNRWGQPEDIAKTCLYLAADSPFTTGANIYCTGGCELGLTQTE